MSRGRLVALLLGLGVLSAPPRAHAASEEPQGAELERLKSTAFRQFAGGEYAEGIRNMEAAYRLAPRPEFLFNIAFAYQKWGGHCPEALRAFRHFFLVCGDCAAGAKAKEPYAEVDRRCLAELAAGSAEVTLRAEEKGALLRLEGELVALGSPSTVRLAPGEHRVRVVAGERTAEHRVHVFGPVPMAITLALDDPRPAPRLVLRNVGLDEVRLDDEHVAGDGALVIGPGRRLIRFLEGVHLLGSVELYAEPGQTYELDVAQIRAHLGLPSAAPLAAADARAPERPSRPWPTLTWVGTAVALTGAVVGGIFTVEALGDVSRHDDTEQQSPGNLDLLAETSDNGTRHALIANVAFGTAIAGVALAVGAYLLAPDDAPIPAPTSGPAASTATTLRW